MVVCPKMDSEATYDPKPASAVLKSSGNNEIVDSTAANHNRDSPKLEDTLFNDSLAKSYRDGNNAITNTNAEEGGLLVDEKQQTSEDPEASSDLRTLKTGEDASANKETPSVSCEDVVSNWNNITQHDATFPQQLMHVIESETKDGGVMLDGERVVEWLPSGDAFVIRDKATLERDVLPKYFNAKCKFMSFLRKLYRQVII